MSLKDLFKEQKNLKSAEPLSKEDYKEEIESFDYAQAIEKRNARFVATEGFENPSSFARFGLAEKYYQDSISKIHETYPYDGSLKEKVLWEVSSSLVDLYLFENGYPRTTGFANFLTGAADTGAQGIYFYPPADYIANGFEYILAKGGPHPGTGDSLYYNQITDEVVYRKDANIYDLSDNRENNLLIDGTKGNTVEFWLKKEAFKDDQEYFEFVLDTHVTGTIHSDANYGRLVVALATTGTIDNSDNQPIYLSYASGSNNIRTYIGASTLTTASIADGNWHHYSVRMKTTGSNTAFDLFVDGQYNDTTITAGTTIGYVSGAIVATIGAQAASFYDGTRNNGDRGWSTFSGSIDEFRYWKRWRTSKQIQRRWFDQVGGGTNTDISNTDLGVYYKFNEGITQTASIDSTVLDYSGRISNGSWTGYNSTFSRDTGSAILQSSASLIEFRDPIIYGFHPDVISYRDTMISSGSIYDDTNANSLKSFIPAWMLEQNETDSDNIQGDYLLNLLQIISSYFDEAAILLKKLPQLTHAKYYEGQATPPPFNKKGLESIGFIAPEIFVDADLLEKFEDRDDALKFEKGLQEVKNIIYQNIYNNLNYIYKSKGTEKSIRNLLRCFGIGDNVLKINLYGNETVYKLEDNLRLTTKSKNYVNFNEIGNNDGSVYQYKIDDNSTSFISGTSATDGTFEGAGLAFTVESNVILPNRVSISEYSTVRKGFRNKIENLYPLHLTASLFGVHTATGTENDLTWASNDYANLQVLTVKDDRFSSNAYFKLTGTLGGFMPSLTSSVFENVYDDQLWSISVTVEPTKKESINQVSGTADSAYTVRFYGVNHIADYKAQEFLVTGTITNDAGRKILSSPKRVFVGSHRTNFTGSLIDFADTKIGSCKAWYSSIPTGTIDNHNLKLGNFGAEKPTQNAFLYQDSINDRFVPQDETLALLWDFTTVTGSDASGEFSVEDETSGSANDDRYGWFSGLVSRRHTASGSFFLSSSATVVQSLERSAYQSQVPEVLLDSNLTRILSQDDEYLNRNTRPTTYHLSIEKNLFQDISEEMLNMFGSVVWFNNMIGTPVNVYRGEYKELKKAADLFFEKVDNDYDFDKYVEYFKFIDYSVSLYLTKLIPVSMLSFDDGVSTVIENFVLGDRNKFANKYPLLKEVKVEPEARVLAINELLYPWKEGHAPLNLGEIKATATMTGILDNNTIPAALDSQTIIITDAVGLTKTYKFLNGGGKSNGDLDGGAVVIQLSGEDTKEGLVDNIEQVIEHANGHNGSITVVRSGAVITLTQATVGTSGNTTITFSAGINTSTELSKTDFSGGEDPNTKENSVWWQERAEKSVTPSGVGAVDTDKQYILDVITSENSASGPTLYNNKAGSRQTYEGSTYALRRLSRPYKTTGLNQPDIKGGANGYQNKRVEFWDSIRKRPTPSTPGEGGLISIEPPSSSLNEFNDSIDNLSLNRGKRKYSFSAGTSIDSANEFSQVFKGQLIFPFSLYSSSVTNNPAMSDLQDFKSNLAITNLHHDSYGDFAEVPMQGPFTEKYVGGRPYRHVMTNFTPDNNPPDSEGERLEGWRLTASSEGMLDLVNVDPAFPKSVYFREEYAKRPVNIKNIQQLTGAVATEDQATDASDVTKIGNYTSTYEIIMTNGRTINNRYLAESDGELPTTTTDSLFVSGVVDFPLPRRDLTGSNKAIIVNRFSAPGDPATMGEGMLDTAAAEFSVYNALPFRNLSVRLPLQELLSNHTNQFGLYSDQFNIAAYDEAGKVYPGGNSTIESNTRAAATMTGILDNNTIPAAFDTETITIIDTFGLSVTYKFMNGGGKNNGDLDGGATVIQLAGEDTKEGLVDNIKQSIETPNGHAGSIIVTRDGAVITLTQIPGTSGNTTITFSAGINTSTELSKTNFSGGRDAYFGTGSFHKVNRNGRKQPKYSNIFTGDLGTISTSASFDNFFLQHAVPQTDAQYAWITASLVENYTGSALFDYESKGLDKGDFASSDLIFVSASNDIGPYSNGFGSFFKVVDFAGTNTIIEESINVVDTNTLGHIAGADSRYFNTTFTPTFAISSNLNKLLPALLSHRGGSNAGANWQLYKKDYHPIVRYQKNHNQIGYIQNKGVLGGNPSIISPINQTINVITNFTEPPITSKYKPLKFVFQEESGEDLTEALVSLGNLRAHFTDHTAESILSSERSNASLNILLPTGRSKQNIKLLTYNPYAAFGNYLDSKKITTITEVSYAESIYPKALYTYLSGTRKRIDFTNDFWRESRENRTVIDEVNSMDSIIQTSSIWRLDAHVDFATSARRVPFSSSMIEEDGVGELQNCYSLFHYKTPANIIAGVNYNRRIKLLDADSNSLAPEMGGGSRAQFLAHSERLDELPQFTALASSSLPAIYSASVGDTFWEATSSDNYKPFYDSYDEYAEEPFRNLKDGTILPEYRISEKMNTFLSSINGLEYNSYKPQGFFAAASDNVNNLKMESGILSLTGAVTQNTTEEFLNRYSFSDFYDYFKLVEGDYEDKRSTDNIPAGQQVRTTKHKLLCEAMLKFLPYDGFYPSERTVQLGEIFSQSLNDISLEGGNASLRTALQPYFAPGILFNSIKSGIAVDYPIFTDASSFESTGSVCWENVITGNFDTRISFGELVEPRINTIVDGEVDLDFRINSTASFTGAKNNHTFAMSNFLAETMNLFVGRDSNSQAMIKANTINLADADIVVPTAGTYSMDIHLINSVNIKTFADFRVASASMKLAPYRRIVASSEQATKLSSSLQINTSSITMYDRAITGKNLDPFLYGSSFGPPVSTGRFGIDNQPSVGTPSFLAGDGNASAYDPFTPPYYNGFSTVRISAVLEEGITTREEIFANASYNYNRLRTLQYALPGTQTTGLSNTELTPNFRHSMQLSASMLLGDENPDNVIYEREELIYPSNPEAGTQVKQLVAFKPRWECPVLDFTNATPTLSEVSGNVAKGMWHQYGDIPTGDNGIMLKIENGTDVVSSHRDLASLLGINTEQTSKIGKLNTRVSKTKPQFNSLIKKEFSEAIIAIPFKYDLNLAITELYHLESEQVNAIKDNLYVFPEDRFDPLNPYNIKTFEEIKESPAGSILYKESKDLYDLMLLMRKYVIPPNLDFLHNDQINPFVMFMIEYSVDLSEKDLQNIWQNVEPTFARQALKVKSETNLHLLPTTPTQGIKGNAKTPNNPYFANLNSSVQSDLFDSEITRWSVFKVKRRAAMNYNSLVGKIRMDGKEYIRKDLGKEQTNDFLYSYNWPYDFFSLIELAKIDSITTFNPNYSEEE